VTRADLEASQPLEIVIRPDPDVPFVPGATGLIGGFSFRPTAPPQPSAFFDGARWSSDIGALFPGLAGDGGYAQPGPQRYYIELRFVDPATRNVAAIYY
jgi:hypothetical protein